MAGVEAWQWLVVEKGSQKGKILNSSENERSHLQVRKEIEQEGQEEIQRLLQQGKNLFFHVVWF